jgi:hypothetical protein
VDERLVAASFLENTIMISPYNKFKFATAFILLLNLLQILFIPYNILDFASVCRMLAVALQTSRGACPVRLLLRARGMEDGCNSCPLALCCKAGGALAW